VIFTDNMRQETLFRGLVACFNALGFVPWVLVFDLCRGGSYAEKAATLSSRTSRTSA
jgi:hypothetical protein